MLKNILLTTAYLPPIEYFAAYSQSEKVYIEIHEHYIKQTYRNRCALLNVDGIIELSIPVSKTRPNHCPISEMRIDYAENWQRNHWRSIETSYCTSPFFLYYRDYIEPFYNTKKYNFLLDFNMDMLEVICKLLKIKKKHEKTIEFQALPADKTDLRALIHPKRRNDKDYAFKGFEKYTQVFADKQNFQANLSILDLLCNKGNESSGYLMRQHLSCEV